MQNKGLLNIALIAVLLIVVGYFAARGERADTEIQAEGGQPVLPGLKDGLEQVSRIEVRKAGNELIAALERHEDRWVLANRDAYPADFAQIRELLTALSEAQTREQKTANPDFYAQLGLREITSPETAARLVEVQSGEQHHALLVGKRAEGWKSSYVRLPESGSVSWVLDREIVLDDKTSNWLDDSLADVKLERIQEVTHAAPDGSTLRIVRQTPEQMFEVDDVPDGRVLKYPEIPEIVADVLDGLRLEDVQKGDALPGGEAEIYQAAFRTFDGLVVNAQVTEQDGQHYLRLSAGHQVAETDQAVAEARQAVESGAAQAEEAVDPAPIRDVAAEAQQMQARWQGWIFRIAEYRYRGFAKQLDELLKDEDDSETQG